MDVNRATHFDLGFRLCRAFCFRILVVAGHVRAEDGDLVVVAAVLGGELAALGRAVAEAADLALFRGSTRPAAVVNPH